MGITPLVIGAFDLGATLLASLGWDVTSLGTSNSHQDMNGNGSTNTALIEGGPHVATPGFDATTARHVAFYYYAAQASTLYVRLYKLGSVQARVDIAFASGASYIYRGDGSSSLATATFTNVGGHYIEIEANCDDSGRIRVWLDRAADSAPFLDTGAAVDTQQQATSGFDQVSWYATGNNSRLADVLVLTSTDGRIAHEAFCIVTRPTGDGTTCDLTPSSGADNYAMVDETSPSTADYNETTVSGDLDRYTYGALPYTPQNVLCISPVVYVARDGTITQARTTIDSGGTTDDGTYQAVGSAGSYRAIIESYPSNPDTSTDWTETTVNAVEAGPQFSS
jgi:hypothetical protein